MINRPELGMKVIVVDAKCCFGSDDNNHTGKGKIVSIDDDDDSFEVQMDDFPEEAWFRCKHCVRCVQEDVGQAGYVLVGCPHCDKTESLIIVNAAEEGDGLGKGFAVGCDITNDGCGAAGGYRSTVEEAVEVWNMRGE